jgi:hypothetical protein
MLMSVPLNSGTLGGQNSAVAGIDVHPGARHDPVARRARSPSKNSQAHGTGRVEAMQYRGRAGVAARSAITPAPSSLPVQGISDLIRAGCAVEHA